MDSNSYPPPPSVPEPPPTPPAPPESQMPPAPAAPAPGAVPPAAPPPGMPPGTGGPAAPEPKKKNKALIIAIVVLAVLLLCCGGAALGGWALFSAAEDEITNEIPQEPDVDTEAPDSGDTGDTSGDAGAPAGGLPEWTAFQPSLVDTSIYAAPTAEQAALAEEVTAEVYPGFRVEDVVVEPGGEDAENYYPDIIYVKAAYGDEPSARIAYYFWADPEAAAAAGVHLGPEQAESYETLAESSDGTSYIYDHENLDTLVGGVSQPDLIDVLAQADQDFPGYVAFISGMDGESIGIVVTRWEVFPDLAEGLTVTYSEAPGGWTVDEITDW